MILDERTAAVEVLVWSPLSGNTVAFLKGYAFFRCCGGLYFFPGSARCQFGEASKDHPQQVPITLCASQRTQLMWKDGSLEC